MPQLKFPRKLGTTWVFELTWRARGASLTTPGPRQSIAGATQRKAFWRTLSSDVVFLTDTDGTTIDETADPETFGDFTYELGVDNQTAFVAGGTYRLDFEATINGKIVPAPEGGYIIVEVLP